MTCQLPDAPSTNPGINRVSSALERVSLRVADHPLDINLASQKRVIRTYSEETAKQGPENVLDALSTSGPAVRPYSEGRATQKA